MDVDVDAADVSTYLTYTVTGSPASAATLWRTSALIPDVAPVKIDPTFAFVDVDVASSFTNS